jgi:hypothetical protein
MAARRTISDKHLELLSVLSRFENGEAWGAALQAEMDLGNILHARLAQLRLKRWVESFGTLHGPGSGRGNPTMYKLTNLGRMAITFGEAERA